VVVLATNCAGLATTLATTLLFITSSTSGLTAYFRNVPDLATVGALLILEFAVGLGVVGLATDCAGLAARLLGAAALALAFTFDGFHCLPIGCNLLRFVLLPVVVIDIVPSVGVAILGIDALLFGHDDLDYGGR